jgi:hypothetical protein
MLDMTRTAINPRLVFFRAFRAFRGHCVTSIKRSPRKARKTKWGYREEQGLLIKRSQNFQKLNIFLGFYFQEILIQRPDKRCYFR